MISLDLKMLGSRVAELRIGQQLKQKELAYEAGVSSRTLQRMEAGAAVKTDALLRVLGALGRLDGVMAALTLSEFSPYEMLADSGLKVSELGKQKQAQGSGRSDAKPALRKRRVRRAAGVGPEAGHTMRSQGKGGKGGKEVQVQWPEDQR